MEYQRLDSLRAAMYRNQFNAPLDAVALLRDQIEPGYDDVLWSEVKYKGSALSDAFILLSMVTEDWEELGLTYMGDIFQEWTLGETDWPEYTASDDDASPAIPYIGCNVDRMGHVPKGRLTVLIG